MSSQDLSKFVHIEGGRFLPSGSFMRNEWMNITQINELRERSGNIGVFTTAYIYDSLDLKEANLYGDFYLDFDDEDNFEGVRKNVLDAIFYFKLSFLYNIPEKLMRFYFSGKKGVHIIIPASVLGIEPDKYLNHYYKQMALEATKMLMDGKQTGEISSIDPKIYDNRRLFRLPNSRHQDTGLYKIPLTAEEIKIMPYEEILELAKEPRNIQWERPYEVPQAKKEFGMVIERWNRRWQDKFNNTKRNDTPLEFDPPCIEELLDSGPVKGRRNNSAAALTSFFKQRGYTEQEAWEKLQEWNGRSLTEQELKHTMNSVWNGDYDYGCSTFETLSMCSDKCPIARGRKR